MIKPLIAFLLCTATFTVKAQTQPFGEVNIADLKMTLCDFEQDANVMVIFDDAEVNTGFTSTTVLRHKRIKILNDKGRDEANVSLAYYSRHGLENMSDLKAETVNLEKSGIEYLPVEETAIYKQPIDKFTKKITFTFPRVKAGSVIEYSYRLTFGFAGGFPDWEFQGDLPVRYSSLSAYIRKDYVYKIIQKIYQPYAQDTQQPWVKGVHDTIGFKHIWSMNNVRSYRQEPYSTCKADNLERIQFILSGIKFSIRGDMKSLDKSWEQIGGELIDDPDFGQQLKVTLKSEAWADTVKPMSTDDEKIGFIFDKVKNAMKWNGSDSWYTNDGVESAWSKKSGNSTEINLILYNYLKNAGIKCYPLIVSTRGNGKVIANYADIGQFNKTVVSCTNAANKT